MLETLSSGFARAKTLLTGKATLTATNIDEAVREIRRSLLEADVALSVVRTFLDTVKERAIGEVVVVRAEKKGKKFKVSPSDHFVRICQHELVKIMGPVEKVPIVFQRPLTSIMLVGLQGTGKTTTCGKLGHWLQKNKRRVLLVAADVTRPAAILQLQTLGAQLHTEVFSDKNADAVAVCRQGLQYAQKKAFDVVIFDTAGRLAIDQPLMTELDQIKAATQPHDIFLVCDAMAGQDTVRSAQLFHKQLGLSGFILTKLDGDARGGAALSIKAITGVAIKFLGTGETLQKLERFRPEGLASRILGMGDVVGLMEDFEQVIDEKQAEKQVKKLLKGQFGFDDFLGQLRLLKKMGPISNLLEKMPLGFNNGKAANPMAAAADGEQGLKAIEAMICSMTPAERQSPVLLQHNLSRITRIARGSGHTPKKVEDLLNRFTTMQNMMKNLEKNPNMLQQIPGMQEMMQQQNSSKTLGWGNATALKNNSLMPTASLPHNGLTPAHALVTASKDRQKLKLKRKQAKQARKKARR